MRYAVEFEITPAALTAAYRLQTATLLKGYRMGMVVLVVVGIGVALAYDAGLGSTLILTGLALLAMTWMEFLDRWLFRNRGRGYVGGRSTYVVDDDGIHYTSPLGSGVYPWSTMTDVRVNDEVIVFGRERMLVAYVPVTAFGSLAERDSFLEFVREHVGQAEPVP